MRIKFSKMQGAGNDFVVFDGVRQEIELDAARARRLADRHFGIGCDQILLVAAAPDARADFRYRIFNADGGEVEQCGNGARCFARFVHDKGLTDRREIRVLTDSGLITPRIETDGQVTVDMGLPEFALDRVPFDASGLQPLEGSPSSAAGPLLWPLDVHGKRIAVAVLSMGNPHAMQLVGDVLAAPVADEGPAIERHPRFPKRVNAGFMQVIDRDRIRLRVFERGAGETLACGTGACAAVVSGIMRGLLNHRVIVETRGGELTIAWAGADNAFSPLPPVLMTGPAVTVFEGEIDWETLNGALERNEQ